MDTILRHFITSEICHNIRMNYLSQEYSLQASPGTKHKQNEISSQGEEGNICHCTILWRSKLTIWLNVHTILPEAWNLINNSTY